MRDSSGWRRRVSGWVLVGTLGATWGCVMPVTRMDSNLLPAFPSYEWEPQEIPCGAERCVVVRKADQVYLVKWTKLVCFTLTGDRPYCQMEGGPP